MLCDGLPLHHLLLNPVRRLVERRIVANHNYPLRGKHAGTDLARGELHTVQSPRSDCVLSKGEIFKARTGSLSAHLVSVGILIWLTYGYAHLSIGAPFNAMFLVYVSVMSLAGFAMLDGLLRVDVAAAAPAFAQVPRRATAWFLAIAGAGIGVLWLSEIVVALPGGLPTNIHLSELPNPTWVLDLGWIIPTALAAALMLRRRHPAGPVIAGAMLVMLVILSVTMLAVVPFALAAGLGADPLVSQQLGVFTVLFTVLGGIESWLLARARRRLGVVTSSWLRRGWWPQTS